MDLDGIIDQLMRCEIIKELDVRELCTKAREILLEESNVQRVDSPVTVRDSFGCSMSEASVLIQSNDRVS